VETDYLIQKLADASGPVARLSPPSKRVATWLALSLPYVALVVLVVSPRADLGLKLLDARYVIEQLGALMTGITAALAAFASTVPAFDRRIMLLPLASFAVWFGSLGLGCVQSWVQFGAASLTLRPDWFCFPAIVLIGIIPAVAVAFMLRRGAPLTPHITAALGGLAAAGLGNFGLRFFHPQDVSIMVLVWQMGTVFALAMLAGSTGSLLLSWRALTANIRHTLTLSNTRERDD